MTLPALVNAIRLQLLRHKKIINEQIQSQCNNNVEALYWLQQIFDLLLFENFAEDDQQLGLCLIQAGTDFDIVISYSRKNNINGRIDDRFHKMDRRFSEHSGHKTYSRFRHCSMRFVACTKKWVSN